MTREAFDLSERFHDPGDDPPGDAPRAQPRQSSRCGEARAENPSRKAPVAGVVDPAARQRARASGASLLDRQPADPASASSGCALQPPAAERRAARDLGVITTGSRATTTSRTSTTSAASPPHLHIGAYPFPVDTIRRARRRTCSRVLVLEEGYPFVERAAARHRAAGARDRWASESGDVPPDGELTPDIVRARARPAGARRASTLAGPVAARAGRRSCAPGCPHGDSFDAHQAGARRRSPTPIVTSDIGCYTLGALPPYNAIESCVCMGASVGMAKGAADAGLPARRRGHRRQHVPALGRHAADGRGRRRTPT